MRTSNILLVLREIRNHPLTAGDQVAALKRYVGWQLKSRLLRKKIVIRWVNSSKLLVTAGMWGATMNIYCGLQDFAEMSFLLHLLRPGDLLADVGANVGAYTVLSSSAIGAESLAIEPVSSTFRRLSDNIEVNGMRDRVDAIHCGVADSAGTLSFTTAQDTLNRVVQCDETAAATEEVRVETLDAILGEREPVLMKLDVEGYEGAALKGASRALARESLWAMLVELEGHGEKYGFDEDMVRQRLHNSGFVPYRYLPRERSLRQCSASEATANVLYVRESKLASVAERVRSATRFRVLNESI